MDSLPTRPDVPLPTPPKPESWLGKEKITESRGERWLGSRKIVEDKYWKGKPGWIGNDKIERDQFGKVVKIGDKEVKRDSYNQYKIIEIGGEKVYGDLDLD